MDLDLDVLWSFILSMDYEAEGLAKRGDTSAPGNNANPVFRKYVVKPMFADVAESVTTLTSSMEMTD